jgi:hypothetical protein
MPGISAALSLGLLLAPPVTQPPGVPDGADAQVSSPSTARQCNATLAIDPTDPLHLLAAADDYRNADANGQNVCVYYTSFDGGSTWIENLFPNPDNYFYCEHARVAFGPNGEPYFLARGAGSIDIITRIYVGTSTDGGVTIQNWRRATVEDKNAGDLDPRLVIDPGPGTYTGSVYVVFTHEGSTTLSSGLATSHDGGLHWRRQNFVSDSNYCIGSAPLVGMNGELYIAYYDFNDATIKLATSTDGGATWGVDVKVCDAAYLMIVPHTVFKTNSYPFLAIDRSAGPYGGTMYVCLATDPGTGSGADVFVTSSTDGGATWSALQRVNDDTTANSQFFPSIEVDSHGRVNVGFYDRRDDPKNVSPRYYVARSLDGGATWQKNVAAADVSFDPTHYPQGALIGDLTAVASSDHTLHAMWTDGRNGDDDIYQSTVDLDLFTDVAGISAATGGTANFTLDAGPNFQGAGYRVLGSVSGTAPGITLHGVNVPLNYDPFMLLTITAANSATFPGFSGALGSKGDATAAVVTPPIAPALIGLTMDFSFFVKSGGVVAWASSPTQLTIVP